MTSAPLRATGIGSRLSEQLDQIARTAGDSDMVVSATPSENTVRFYLGRGFQPVAEPVAELFELEPEDVHIRPHHSGRAARSNPQQLAGSGGADLAVTMMSRFPVSPGVGPRRPGCIRLS